MEKKSVIRKVINFLIPYKKQILVMSILMIALSSANMFVPLLQEQIVDKGLVSGDMNILISAVLIMIILRLVINLITAVQTYLQVDLNVTFMKDKQMEILNHVLKLRVSYMKNDGVLQIISDANYSMSMLSEITGSQVSTILLQIFKFVGTLVGLSLISWKLTLLLLGIIPVRLIITHFISKYIEKYSMEELYIQKDMHRWEQDTYNSVVEIKLWNLIPKRLLQYRKFLMKRNKAIKKASACAVTDSFLGEGLQQILFNAIYIVGGYFILGDGITLGGLLAFITYANYFVEPLELVSQIKMILAEIFPAIESYEDFLALEEEENKELHDLRTVFPLDNQPLNISFNNVSFGYGDRELLKNVSFDMKSGETIAVIGDNGSGKTTLISLLLRFYQTTKGYISLNDTNIMNIELEEYRQLFAVVLQNPHLFQGDILENITLEKDGRELSQNIQESPLLDFVEKLPDRYNTNVGSDAGLLSGGEKQKVALARAFNYGGRIMILDEPTSNYDVKSKMQFVNAIKDCGKDIVIMITHDPELLCNADKIIWVHNESTTVHQDYSEINNLAKSVNV